jgi:hypothetical protein
MIISLLMSEIVSSFVYMLMWNFLVVFFGCSLKFIINVRHEGSFLWTTSTPVFSGHSLFHMVIYWSLVTFFNCISYCGNGFVPNFVSDFPILVCLYFNFLHHVWIVFSSVYNLYSPSYQADNGRSVCFRQVFPVGMLHCLVMEKSVVRFETWNYYCRPLTMVLLHKCKIPQSVCLT